MSAKKNYCNHLFFCDGWWVYWLFQQRAIIVNIRWVDEQLRKHESFVLLYKVDTIDADILASAIRDVLVRMNANIANCRGQCYDGASNMSVAHRGVAKLINQEDSPTIYMHCYGHALNQAVGDCIWNLQRFAKVRTLDASFEITRLIKFFSQEKCSIWTNSIEQSRWW